MLKFSHNRFTQPEQQTGEKLHGEGNPGLNTHNRLSNKPLMQCLISGHFVGVALLFGLVGPAQAADVYKWVDASGVTHYSARPPENGALYEEIRVQGQLSQRTRPSSTTEALEDDEADDADSDNQDFTRPGSEVSVKNPDKVAANCQRAHKNIETIESRRRVSLNDGNGGQRRLTDDERLALLEESQKYLDRWCRDN